MTHHLQTDLPIFIVSGGKGIAGHTMVESLIIQYPNNKLNIKIVPDVQSEERIVEVVTMIKQKGGILTHTMVNARLRHFLIAECKRQQVVEIDFMGKLADYLESELGLKSQMVPGLYRRINEQYFNRIEAIEFTLNHDDGINTGRLNQAEIILTGVSRSGKTPLSVYMSMFGWKVANVPLVRGIDPPIELFEVDPQRVFGLNISKSQLITQRFKRLSGLNNLSNSCYIDDTAVAKEIQFANLIFSKGGFTVINVSNKAIESTANEIIGLVSDRFDLQHRKLKDSNN